MTKELEAAQRALNTVILNAIVAYGLKDALLLCNVDREEYADYEGTNPDLAVLIAMRMVCGQPR